MFRFTGLDEAGLHRVRLDRDPLGPVDVDRLSGIILGGGSYIVSDPAESKSEDKHRVKCDLSTCWTRSSSATSRSSAWRLPTSCLGIMCTAALLAYGGPSLGLGMLCAYVVGDF
jgi:hypothetical protein